LNQPSRCFDSPPEVSLVSLCLERASDGRGFEGMDISVVMTPQCRGLRGNWQAGGATSKLGPATGAP